MWFVDFLLRLREKRGNVPKCFYFTIPVSKNVRGYPNGKNHYRSEM